MPYSKYCALNHKGEQTAPEASRQLQITKAVCEKWGRGRTGGGGWCRCAFARDRM